MRIIGDGIEWTVDTAADLRRRYEFPGVTFAVALVGKDRTVAIRSDKPVASASLTRAIDAMPMRRAGQQ